MQLDLGFAAIAQLRISVLFQTLHLGFRHDGARLIRPMCLWWYDCLRSRHGYCQAASWLAVKNNARLDSINGVHHSTVADIFSCLITFAVSSLHNLPLTSQVSRFDAKVGIGTGWAGASSLFFQCDSKPGFDTNYYLRCYRWDTYSFGCASAEVLPYYLAQHHSIW